MSFWEIAPYYDIIQQDEHPATRAIIKAFNAVLPSAFRVGYICGRVEHSNYDEDWRKNMLEIIEGKRALNQGKPIQDKPRFSWENLEVNGETFHTSAAKDHDRGRLLKYMV